MRIYQGEERRAEGEGDHPPATRFGSASGSPQHLHSLLASTFGRPPGRLQRALQPLHGVPPLVEQSIFFLFVVVVFLLHTGEANMFLFDDGGRSHPFRLVTAAALASGGVELSEIPSGRINS